MLTSPFQLPCGVTLHNRIAKSAMSENMANRDHSPSKEILQLYTTWAKGGAGLIVTGNVMVDSKALGEPRNVVVEDKRHFSQLQQWANTIKGTNADIWPQINHPGRQAMGAINARVVAPSAIAVKVKRANFMFKKPKALTEEEIWELVERYGNTAQIMKEAGFTGAQIHGAHGYLVSQFLSPLSNIRKDQWGGSLENRARFALEVYRNIRKKVGTDYPVAIKINSADFQRGGFTEEESMEVVRILAAEGMDLIEISGGTYEKAAMMGAIKKQSTIEREAYFMDYIEKVRKVTDVPLMLTGGFRTVSVMENALAQDQLDIVGVARPFSIYPNFPNEIFNKTRTDIHIPTPKVGIKSIDKMGFVDLIWHELHLKRLGQGKEPDLNLSALKAIAYNMNVTVKKLLFK